MMADRILEVISMALVQNPMLAEGLKSEARVIISEKYFDISGSSPQDSMISLTYFPEDESQPLN
jgi:hypothetical protein